MQFSKLEDRMNATEGNQQQNQDGSYLDMKANREQGE